MIHIERAKHSKCSNEFRTSLEWKSQLYFQVRSLRRFERSPSFDEFSASFEDLNLTLLQKLQEGLTYKIYQRLQ